MTLEEIKHNLCVYDTRHPEHGGFYRDEDKAREPRKNCWCDNCQYGRDKLAVELLKYKDLLEKIMSKNSNFMKKESNPSCFKSRE